MYTVIGLGNVGDEYKNTRHNVAWIVFDDFISSDRWQKNKYAESEIANTRISDNDVLFVKPLTFMNESGRVLPYLMKTYGTSISNLIVVHDDIDLPLGITKISYERGDGGHNGVKSIMAHLESKEFIRVRIGVSLLDENGIIRKPDVLGNFNKEESEIIKNTVAPRVAKIIEIIIKEGKDKAMTLYN